jgi:hypothetical protein
MSRLVFGLIATLSAGSAMAALYSGNGETGYGGVAPVGQGTLGLTDNGTRVFGTFTKGPGDLVDILVIFIDSTAGGFGSTANFTDHAGTLQTATSGFNGSSRATATFAPGFKADYAIALRPNASANWSKLFRLVDNGTLGDLGPVNLDPISTKTATTYTFSFDWASIGVTPGPGASFRFESSYIGADAYRTLQSFERFTPMDGDPPSVPGLDSSVTFTNFDTYLTAVPEMTNAALTVFAGLIITGGLVSRAWRSFAGRRLQSGL